MSTILAVLVYLRQYAKFQSSRCIGFGEKTCEIWFRGYKKIFILNSAVHGILNAHKYQNLKKSCFFPGSDKPITLIFSAHKC